MVFIIKFGVHIACGNFIRDRKVKLSLQKKKKSNSETNCFSPDVAASLMSYILFLLAATPLNPATQACVAVSGHCTSDEANSGHGLVPWSSMEVNDRETPVQQQQPSSGCH